ncbi:MBL fold metallo-hydrolase [Chordicoccus furentiruminis]|jgi:L-ascorbate metabolism protein UlaG (beta-lactamase superfamily)|uniref:MBL fold metallo-hydrolase n=2 Tax=Lachnospiraceae TaxID=186803 RepID=UPI0023A8D68D|nr:MBL fold metallo-hydrolase [Chordicoccus furentiruminis]
MAPDEMLVGGKMIENIEVFTQSSIRITDGDCRIYIDPFQMSEAPKDADFILITHDHYDHFSPEDIEKVSNGRSVLLVPAKMIPQADKISSIVGEIHSVMPGEHYGINGLEFDTVAAYNNLKPFHPKSAGWVGYILQIDGQRIYIAGDTDMNRDNQDVKCDVALVPIGGKFTMDAKKAAEFINTIQPSIAIPTHYGSIVGKKEDADVFAAGVKAPIRTEIKMLY